MKEAGAPAAYNIACSPSACTRNMEESSEDEQTNDLTTPGWLLYLDRGSLQSTVNTEKIHEGPARIYTAQARSRSATLATSQLA